MADTISQENRVAVLDGDPFQPLWYNWIFSELDLESVPDVIEFYSKAILSQKLRFPEKYFVLKTSEMELRKRKENDETRSRQNFEKHLRLIAPQLEYFASMNDSFPGTVDVVQADSPVTVSKYIVSNIAHLPNDINPRTLFQKQRDFVLKNRTNQLV